MSILFLRDVSIGYAHQVIGQHITIEFQSNQVTCLLGANGCGKTTLLKTILGILPVLAGELFIQQKEQSHWTHKALAQFMGYVPQAHSAIFPFTVEETVLMGRTAHFNWYQTPKQQDKEIVDNCLSTLGIEHLKYKNYMKLSGGERQLVLIARALAQQPAFLIMDEPTASLDFGNQIRVLEQITQLKEQGMAILLTTHQPDQIALIADQAILFYQGSTLAQGKTSDVLTIENLAKLYQVDSQIIKRNLSSIIS